MADPSALCDEIDRVCAQLQLDAARQAEKWRDWKIRPDFAASAENLAAYLALRHYDLRATQRDLMELGLSSLGRLESRVLPTLHAVRASLAALAGRDNVAQPKK
jgi:pyruvate kinase